MVFCIADKMSEAANLQTAFSRGEEDNDRQLLELHAPILPNSTQVAHTSICVLICTHLLFFKGNLARKKVFTRVRHNRYIPLTIDSSPGRGLEIVEEVKTRGGFHVLRMRDYSMY